MEAIWMHRGGRLLFSRPRDGYLTYSEPPGEVEDLQHSQFRRFKTIAFLSATQLWGHPLANVLDEVVTKLVEMFFGSLPMPENERDLILVHSGSIAFQQQTRFGVPEVQGLGTAR